MYMNLINGNKKNINLYKNKFIRYALDQSMIALAKKEVPVGSVGICNSKIISINHNEMQKNIDPTSHAEISCIKEMANKLKTSILTDCDIYISTEPCAMCAQAIAFSKIKKIYFGAFNKKFGAIYSQIKLFNTKINNYIPEVYRGIENKKSSNILKYFFTKINKL